MIAILLSLLMTLGLVACAEKDAAVAEGLSVGYAIADINPTTSMALDGYSGLNSPKNRRSGPTEWPLQAVVTAITDAKGQTVMIVALDLLNAYMADGMRDVIAGETGIPKSNIIFHCTHNHSGVSTRVDVPGLGNYIAGMTDNILAAAREAMADRKPVTEVSTGFTRVEGCNFVRHYLLTSGRYVTGTTATLENGEQFYGHYGQPDNLLQMVKFSREGAKAVVLVNWQAHPCAKIDMSIVTTDYPGVMRAYMAENMDCLPLFIQGGAGNLGGSSLVPTVTPRASSADYQNMGRTLGAEAAAVVFTPIKDGDIYIKEQSMLLDNLDGGATKIFVTALSIGEFAMITAPFEIFDTNAMYVKENSPYKMTFYTSCANGSNSYLSTPPSYEWKNSYEAGKGLWSVGTAEILQDAQLTMLTELFATTGQGAIQKPDGYVRSEFVPVSDGVTYQIMGTGYKEMLTACENGFYSFKVKNEKGITRTLLAKNEELANEIIMLPSAQFIFDEQSVIVDIVR